MAYCKVPKFSGTRKLCCNLPKFQTKRQKFRAFYQNDANGIANSEDPDQTAEEQSDLGLDCLQTYLFENLGSLGYDKSMNRPEDQWSCKRSPDYNHNCETRKMGNINFLDVQEQQTLWSLIGSGRISNSSKLLCMSSLTASMKRI